MYPFAESWVQKPYMFEVLCLPYVAYLFELLKIIFKNALQIFLHNTYFLSLWLIVRKYIYRKRKNNKNKFIKLKLGRG